MCEVKVFKKEGENEVLLLSDVYLVEEEDGGIRFETIFGEQRIYEAEIESVSFSDNKVIIRNKSRRAAPIDQPDHR
jgi:predicted RNA-binding protein